MRETSNLTHKLGLTVLLSLTSVTSFAGPSKFLFLWDNTVGLTYDTNCTVEATDKVPFKVSQYSGNKNLQTENLRNYNGVRQSHLINYSIVKDRIGPSKSKYSPITVVGVNERSSAERHRWISKRNDKGYIYNESLRPMEDFVFGVDIDKTRVKKEIFEGLPEIDGDQRYYLRIASGVTYYKATCKSFGQKEFYVFRAYQKENSESALMYIGISDEETSILSKVHTYGKVESMAFLKEVGNERGIQVSKESFMAAVNADPNIEEEMREMEEKEEEAQVAAEEAKEEEAEEVNDVEETTAATTMDQVVCIGSSTLNVRNKELDNVLFKAGLGDSVKVFQSWSGDDKFERTIGGVDYTFIKVEFPDREANLKTGYVAQRFVKGEKDCDFLVEGKALRADPAATISGLNDSKCCDFPTVKKPTHSYTSGMRRYGAGRSGGKRLHAACDLYRYKNEPIRSVAPGKVLRGLYYFYQGTYALEVRHDGGFVVRYGETTGKKMVSGGSRVKMGQSLGTMGKVNSNCCRPMLHFELYSGSKTGPLKGGGRYQRRSDLMNPTKYLQKWESMVF